MKKIILLICIFYNIFALNLNDIQNDMQKNIDNSLKLLKNKNLNLDQIATQIFKIFDPIFDYKLMAKLSLSKNFNKLNEQEKEIYIKTFEQNLKQSFTNKLKLYKDEILKVQNGKLINENRYFLTSSMMVNGEEKIIIFKFYNDNNNWLIYDVDILGVSLIQTYRSQFLDIFEKNGFKALINSLKNTQ